MKKLLITTIITLLATVNAYAGGLSSAINAKMNYLIERQGVISSNIANSSTPNYIAKDIVYNAKPAKRNVMIAHTTNSKHIALSNTAGSSYKQIEDKTYIRNDGNSVRADQQMLNLAQIQQEYTLATRLYSKHMAMQKLVVQNK